ncbi:MAG: hypothetical protein ISN29_05125 [Gammaproteobacteria bacterium AqS3]|nr:hypothetical protein [Gammaproteobacteria bacterium AqS3]
MARTGKPRSSSVSKSISAFGEDACHRIVIGTLIERVAEQMNVEAAIKWHNSIRGQPRVVRELKEYFRDLENRGGWPDLIVVVMDANDKGWNKRIRDIPKNASPVPVVRAIPEPYIESWLMLDNEAFSDLFGKGFQTPKKNFKHNRDFYKHALREAYIQTGSDDDIGVIDIAKKIAPKINLKPASGGNKSLKRFLKELRDALQQTSH